MLATMPVPPIDPETEDASEQSLASARNSSLFVTSFEKGLKILSAFDRTNTHMGLRDLMGVTQLDQSTVQRFTFTLHALGFLNKDPVSKKFSLSPKVLELGFSYLHANSLIDVVTPALYRLNNKWKESFNFIELSGTEVVYVARVPGQHTLSVDVLLGTRLPAYAAAPGRAMLSFMPETVVLKILDQSDLRKLTPETVTDRAELLEMFAAVRAKGYATAVDQCYMGDVSAAVPIFNGAGNPIAAINVSVPSARWSLEALEREIMPDLVAEASIISRNAGAWTRNSWFARSL